MLKRITLENFFSFGEPTTIELNPDVNILLGINGSGKSNFLKAIYLLAEAIGGKGFEKVFLQEWGGFDSVANVSGGKKDYIKLKFVFYGRLILPIEHHYAGVNEEEYHYEITIFRLGVRDYYFKELFTFKDETTYRIYIDIQNGKGQLMGLKDDSSEQLELMDYPSDYFVKEYSKTELIFSQVKNEMALFVWLSEGIEKFSLYNQFDTALRSPIRQPNIFGSEERLLSDGTNLNTIIQKLKNNHSLEYEKIEELLRDINPNFKEITFNLFGSRSYLLLREKNLASAISIEHISDGTLRYLLLLAILYNPNRGSVVCIDEPETGLHPDMISTIANAIKYASKTTQIFIATHSPLLLNRFELEDVFIFEKDQNNQTIVVTKTEEDFKDWDDSYMTGQLWLNGQLGGKRW